MSISTNVSLRVVCLALALFLYGAASSPTPDDPGVVEVGVAVLLLAAMGIRGLVDLLRVEPTGPLWRILAQAFLIFGLSVPLCLGLLAGHAPDLILRDCAGFLFLLMPLVLADIGPFWVIVVGLLFSLRALAPLMGWSWDAAAALSYFSNAPTVLFACVFLLLTACARLFGRGQPSSLLHAGGMLLLSFLALLAMSMSLQRASLGYVALALAVFLFLAGMRAPGRMLIMLTVLIGILSLVAQPAGDLLQALADKTALYGSNQRAAEWQAVWQALQENPVNILFGLGWGGTFESPAVAGIRVNYTHSLLSSLLLKTGLVGLVLGSGYIFALLVACARQFRAQPVMVLALMGPMLIDIFLYASYKSLDFGLILALAAGCAMRGCKRRAAHVSVKVNAQTFDSLS